MSLLGIIETLRRNLKAVIVGCWVVLALVVVADVVRIMTAGEHHAAASEHTATSKSDISDHKSPTHATTAEHEAHAAVAEAESAEPPKSEISDHKSTPHGEAHGFWAKAYHIAENVPVFWTLFGFLGCVVIVVVCKTYGYLGVSEREDYYGE